MTDMRALVAELMGYEVVEVPLRLLKHPPTAAAATAPPLPPAAAVPDRFAELEARFAAEKEEMTLRYREKLAVTTTDGRIPAGIPNRGSERDSPFLAPCPS
jgi:hypothetical protein